MIVKIEDGWSLNYCSKGMRKFCERHDINWPEFLANGIDEEILLKTGDEYAKRMVEAAHGRRV